MKIDDLKDYEIKVSKNSITAKNDSDKTAGIVRGTEKLADMQFNKQFEFSSKLRKAGLLKMQKDIVVHEKTMYYFENMYTRSYIDDINRLIEHDKMLALFEGIGGVVIPVKRVL